MKRFKIIHRTRYEFPESVQLMPHTLRIRPREGHDLRIETSRLDISPNASLRWHRDVEENSIAIARFDGYANALDIESEILIQKFDLNPHDFLIADYAVSYPFSYKREDIASLSPYLERSNAVDPVFINWLNGILAKGDSAQTFALLLHINQSIFQSFTYAQREEEGVQSPEHTVIQCSGSCRDFANLFLQAAQHLGFAARFISGYVYAGSSVISGATHAWAEVFLPGAGWKGFDPTLGTVVGAEHIATAIARKPELVPPVSGSYFGSSKAEMNVDVWVSVA